MRPIMLVSTFHTLLEIDRNIIKLKPVYFLYLFLIFFLKCSVFFSVIFVPFLFDEFICMPLGKF